MRAINKILTLLIQVLLVGICLSQGQEKTSLTEKDLEKYTYYFDIEDNRFTGAGAKILADEINKNQYILLGEYHDSARISEFTRALIPVFHDAGGRRFALEIGPVSVEILAELSRDYSKIAENLNVFNGKYYVTRPSERRLTPIPFFANLEDAEFLAEAVKRNFDLIGLDQEFLHGYLPLMERMYANLGSRKKRELKPLFEQVAKQVRAFSESDARDEKLLAVSFSESAEIQKFLEAASEKSPENRRIAEALRITNEIYLNNANRKYYAANSGRIDYMKRNLREAFARLKFDLKKEKLLLKMGAVHTGRGFSPLSLFEIGNTLSELAEINGNRSLHLRFDRRFYVENGKEIDILDNKEAFSYRFQPLLQMAKKDRWTIIDLRPLRQAVFYWRRYALDEFVIEQFKNHDLYIIPKMESSARLNIALRNNQK
jgi:hypothetical protein